VQHVNCSTLVSTFYLPYSYCFDRCKAIFYLQLLSSGKYCISLQSIVHVKSLDTSLSRLILFDDDPWHCCLGTQNRPSRTKIGYGLSPLKQLIWYDSILISKGHINIFVILIYH